MQRQSTLALTLVASLVAIGIWLSIPSGAAHRSKRVDREAPVAEHAIDPPSVSVSVDRERSSSPSRTTIRVVESQSGAGIERARVSIADVVLWTDESGRFEVPGGLPDGEIKVAHEQYEPASKMLPDARAAGLIRLVRKSRLRGTVVPPVGADAILAGVTVVAWDQRGGLSASDLHSGDLAPGIHETVCDDGGRFVFDDLPEDASVRLLAGGRGLISQTLIPDASTHRDPPVIQLAWLHGAVIRFIDQEGEPVRPSTRLSPPSNWSVHVRKEFSMRRIPLSSPGLALNGIVHDRPIDTNPELSPIFVSSSQRVDTLGGIEVSTRIPGYEKHTEWVALRIPTDGIDTTEVVLTKVADGFGDLEIRVGARLRRVLSEGRPSIMNFVLARRGHPSIYCVASSKEADDVIRIGQIPFGQYRGKLELKDGTRLALQGSDGDDSLTVSSVVATAIVESDHCSRLRVVITDQRGRAYVGPARFSVGPITSNGLRKDRDYAFSAAPYTFDLLQPTKYGGALMLPELVNLQHDGDFEFEVPDGEELSIAIRLE